MPARAVVGGKTFYTSKGFRLKRRPEYFDASPVPPESPESPFREGVAWTDPQDGITYRVVAPGRLKPEEGWGAAEFWMARYGCLYEDLRRLVERGLLDAALEGKTVTKRFRCRDEDEVHKFFNGKRSKDGRYIRGVRWGWR